MVKITDPAFVQREQEEVQKQLVNHDDWCDNVEMSLERE